MKKIVYGSLSVLTAVCTVFAAAKAEVFSDNRTDAATSEVVESGEVNGLLEAPASLDDSGLGSLGAPLEGAQDLGLDTKALSGASIGETNLSGQRAAKAAPAQGQLAKRLPVSAATGSRALSSAPTSQLSSGSQLRISPQSAKDLARYSLAPHLSTSLSPRPPRFRPYPLGTARCPAPVSAQLAQA